MPVPPMAAAAAAKEALEEEAQLAEAIASSLAIETASSRTGSEVATGNATDSVHTCNLAHLCTWTQNLLAHDAVWSELQEEKRAGWASKAVERYWRDKDRFYDARATGKSGVPTTGKYVSFYSRTLPKLQPEL